MSEKKEEIKPDELYKRLRDKASYDLKNKTEIGRKAMRERFGLGFNVTVAAGTYEASQLFEKIEKALFDRMIEDYVKEEIDKFMRNVDQFKQQMEYLNNRAAVSEHHDGMPF